MCSLTFAPPGFLCIYLSFPVLFLSQGARGGLGDQGPEGQSGPKVRIVAIKFQIHQVNQYVDRLKLLACLLTSFSVL